MALDAHDLELIKRILDERATRTEDAVNRMEDRLFSEVEKIAGKVDLLGSNQQSMAERVSRIEQEATTFRESRFSQGARIGDVEKEIATMQSELKIHFAAGIAVREARGHNREWVKWLIATLITVVGVALTAIFGA